MIVQAFIRGAIVILVAALVATLLRHRSAALRHHVWATAMVVQLAVLAFIPVLPTMHLPVIPTVRAELDAPLPSSGADAAAPSEVTNTRETAAAPAGRPATTSGAGDSSLPLPRLPMLLVVWLVGAGLILLRFLIGTLIMARIAVRGERVDDGDWLVLAQRIARELGITRPITMVWGDKVTVPVTWGVLYPMILLPRSAQEWPAERRRLVLVHELAHVKRFDAFTQLVAQLTTAVFWFSPFVWYAEWRMRVEREHACDDTVLKYGTEPSRYADELLQMVRTLVRRRASQPAFAALAMARRSEFEGRMLAILDPDRPRRVTGVSSGLVFALLSVLIAAPLAAVDPFAVRVVTEPPAEVAITAQAPAQPAMKTESCDFSSPSSGINAEVHEDGLRVRMKEGPRCALLDISGPVRLSPDETRVLAVENGGMLRLRELTPETSKQLFIERTAVGGVQRAFTINGRVPDDDGRSEREWLAHLLPQLLAEGVIAPQERVLRMLKSAGLDATLRQIGQFNTASARLAHFKELLKVSDWSAAELDRIAAAATASLTSRRDLAAFNRALPVRARTQEPLQSDAELLDRILAGMTSDHDLSRAMLAQVPHADPPSLALFARHAARMSSAYELRSFLIAAGPRYFSGDAALAGAWFAAAGKINSAYERRMALMWAVPHAKTSEHALALLRATTSMSGGNDKALLLAQVGHQKLITTPALRAAFLAEVNSLPAGSDRRLVLEALR